MEKYMTLYELALVTQPQCKEFVPAYASAPELINRSM
jgi:hypothetical protein